MSGEVRGWIEAGVKRFGKVNVLYNNAGVMPDADTSVVATDEGVWERVLDVNAKGSTSVQARNSGIAGGGWRLRNQYCLVRGPGRVYGAAGCLYGE